MKRFRRAASSVGRTVQYLALCGIVLVGGLGGCRDSASLPEPGSEAYREAVVAFYTSLAAIQAGEDLGADDHLRRVTELAPDEPAAWANLGLLALRRNALAEAEDYLNRAVALAPRNGQLHQLRAALYSQKGDFDAAIEALRAAVRLAPDDPKALYALVQILERQGGTDRLDDVATLLDRLREVVPSNVAVLLERLRMAALQEEGDTVEALLAALETHAPRWPAEAQDLVATIREAALAGDMAEVSTQVVFLRNVLLRQAAFRQDLAQIQTSAAQVGDLVPHFLRLPRPQPRPAPPDTALTFARQVPDADATPARWSRAFWLEPDAHPIPGHYRDGQLHLGTQVLAGTGTAPVAVAHGDVDYDYYPDVVLAGPEGVRLYVQDSTGTFSEATGRLPAEIVRQAYTGVWMADVDMEGDLDLVLGQPAGAPVVARNNGDGTFSLQRPWGGEGGVRAFAWADLDADGDPDPAVLDAAGRLDLWRNGRQGQFLPMDAPALPAAGRALHANDLDGDGSIDVLVLLDDGAVVRVGPAADTTWAVTPLVQAPAPGDEAWLTAADLDNNGMLDLLVTGGAGTTVWLASGKGGFLRLPAPEEAHVQAVADLDGDGRLDLIGRDADGRPAQWHTRGTRPYHWQRLRLRAADVQGDQRINALAYGARAEVRTGLLYQQQPVMEPVLHFGLGTHDQAELARIVWPNGDVQAEFGLAADTTLRTPQRLKGSCPWVFTYDGERMRFVTDFIWRTALGLRINAQSSGTVIHSIDWIKIDGSELAPRDGAYDVRITAELWETHFFDHVSLMVVDHPESTDVFVDERFTMPPPEPALHAMAPVQPVRRAWDHRGAEVTATVRALDAQYLDTFARTAYQGLADDHYVEVDLGDAPAEGPLWLVASGWVRPTDSSINVAISQGRQLAPQGLQLEVPDGHGGWTVAQPDLGFPAGKAKTVLLDLTEAFVPGTPRRVRLRTNLEIYWDRIGWAAGRPDAALQTQRLDPETADLRYRGFSVVERTHRSAPEMPVYDQLASTAPIWIDLIGYYTRFGDVRDLLTEIDDRYVIMNAGDELALRFPAPPPPPEGWTRDFVLIGDGWVKDGDLNTTFSKTVRPLPYHGLTDYAQPPTRLEDDPAYQLHPDDWRTYHTRYVTTEPFRTALQLPEAP